MRIDFQQCAAIGSPDRPWRSLVHFLLEALPGCTLDVVEIRQQVIDLARECFLLPQVNSNLRIIHAAGGDFVRQRGANSKDYDIIIVDAFDENGPAAALLEKDFLSACRKQLSENGVFVMNLWNGPGHKFPELYKPIRDAFGNNALKLLLSESYRNAVAFGFKDPSSRRNLPGYRSTAAELQSKYKINFTKYLKYFYWQNFDGQDQ